MRRLGIYPWLLRKYVHGADIFFVDLALLKVPSTVMNCRLRVQTACACTIAGCKGASDKGANHPAVLSNHLFFPFACSVIVYYKFQHVASFSSQNIRPTAIPLSQEVCRTPNNCQLFLFFSLKQRVIKSEGTIKLSKKNIGSVACHKHSCHTIVACHISVFSVAMPYLSIFR
jgi:hypothetical protein